MNWEAFLLTLKLALIVAPLLLLIALPISYFIAYSSKSWKWLVEGMVSLPLVLPPTVLGFYLLIVMGSKSPTGRFYEQLTGNGLVFSFNGLLIGSLFYSLPFAVIPLSNAFGNIDRRFLYQSQILGKSSLETFFRVILPLSYRGMLTALILTVAHTIGEFGVVLMIGGNIPGETRTLSIDLFDQVQALNYNGASQTAAFLLCFSYLFLSLIYFINHKCKIGYETH
ncbi:MAG: molybdate ABC transporter permease subunit [Nitrospirota bacterium]